MDSKSLQFGKLEDYQRLFQWRGGLPFLFSDIYMETYRDVGCLILSKDKIWTNYIPREELQKTLEAGVVFLQDRLAFKEFEDGFSTFQDSSIEELKKLSAQDTLSLKDFKYVLSQFVTVYRYYIKTEFIYTDQAVNLSTGDEVLKNNLKTLGQLKEKGRSFMNSVFFDAGNYFDAVLTITCKQFDIAVADLKVYTMEELLVLYDGDRVSDVEIKNRLAAFVFYVDDDGETKFLSGDRASEVINTLVTSKNLTALLKGQVANKGLYTGTVKVVHYGYEDFENVQNEIASMQKGEVLVAESTSPELMAACRKAGAILTNQGGMLSHAAIISRELNIPSIVGLGQITDVLKDGDEVEVNANEGVVKIIKKV